ncbi:hypothetical protein KFK09_014361 [Dendrobium nobile]|uniref:CCHC-type domain-containing protein n=1 Tax=Dendrobium nobile TaxID=94219 RepID=A0A8T3BCR2_DENNO|nr:hypothetical protein KFK09_014361 [Dendrobium nobile]
MDLGAKLSLGVWISVLHGKFFQRAEYEGIAHICFQCGFVGHNISQCPNAPQSSKQPSHQPQNCYAALCECSLISNNCHPKVIDDTNPSSMFQQALQPPLMKNEHYHSSIKHSEKDEENPKCYGLWSLVVTRKSSRQKKKNSMIGIGGQKATPPVSSGEISESAKQVASSRDSDLSNIPFKFSIEAFLTHPSRLDPMKDSLYDSFAKELQRLEPITDLPRKQKEGGKDITC